MLCDVVFPSLPGQSNNPCFTTAIVDIILILDEISDQEQLNEKNVKSWKDHVAVFEVFLEGFSKLYEAHNLHSVCCQFSPTVTKDIGSVCRPKVIIKKENLEEVR